MWLGARLLAALEWGLTKVLAALDRRIPDLGVVVKTDSRLLTGQIWESGNQRASITT